MSTKQDWTTQTGHTMVSLGTHRLSMTISGVARTPGDPIVIILPGVGDVASSYPAVERLVAPFARILLYDRSGLGQSEEPPPTTAPTAVQAAKDLADLLTASNIAPPLLLVAHSYAGIIAREFLHLYPASVAGMVLCETATERQSEYFSVPNPDLDAVQGELSYAQATGLRAESKLSRDEWHVRARDFARGSKTALRESSFYDAICQTLREKRQLEKRVLGNKPLSVIRANSARDYRRIYEKGLEMGNGTAVQREAFRGVLERMDVVDRELQEEQVRLSARSRFVRLEECGHHVHLVRPDVVAEEIRWVRDGILGRGRL